MHEPILDTWPVRRRAMWIAIIDVTLPVVPVFWALVDLVAARIARTRRGDFTPPDGYAA